MYLKKSINNIKLVLAAKIKMKIKIMNVLLIQLLGHIAIIHPKKSSYSVCDVCWLNF